MRNTSALPVVIEAAISPFRTDAPVEDAAGLVREALACLDAGAGIIHHHHDSRLAETDAVAALIDFGHEVLAAHPDALLYPGILGGRKGPEHMAHLEPLAGAGTLGLAPVDPGAAVPYGLDADGLPDGFGYIWNPFATARAVAALALRCDVPLTIGVYEPVQLRWACAYEAAGRLPAGSMVKLYFGGGHSLFEPGRPALNFGLPPTPQALDLYLTMMEGSALPWSVGVMGDVLLDSPLARHALERGGHLRVGIEDMAGMSDATNAETVQAAAGLAAEVGRPVATGAEARAALTGRAAVAG